MSLLITLKIKIVDKKCLFILKRAHSESYIVKNKTLDESIIKKIGFPLVDSVVQRSLVATGGTVLASKLAITNGIACNTAGGSHHANFEGGSWLLCI